MIELYENFKEAIGQKVRYHRGNMDTVILEVCPEVRLHSCLDCFFDSDHGECPGGCNGCIFKEVEEEENGNE